MFRFIALLSILSVAAHTVSGSLLVRQADCATSCEALGTSSQAAGGDLSKLCTQDIVNQYAACYSCEVKSGDLTQSDAQDIINTYAQGCSAAGHAVSSVTIASDGTVSGGSSSSSSAPAGSGSSAKKSSAQRTAAGVVAFSATFAISTLMVL
ncbi:hypothetical protein GGX14DRAFT_560976 [Mycena pura]|uniref:Uncharacterized protein n=1 Tax=Mycena pura TaxID=153505 RepID=A0AAD6YI31_9AGAR|nr:hypothetical protein GGX14DRAFT_560976 [Mycena pura]